MGLPSGGRGRHPVRQLHSQASSSAGSWSATGPTWRPPRTRSAGDDVAAAVANFDGITYPKGASVLKQLFTFVGDEACVAGLRGYFANHAWGNTTLADRPGGRPRPVRPARIGPHRGGGYGPGRRRRGRRPRSSPRPTSGIGTAAGRTRARPARHTPAMLGRWQVTAPDSSTTWSSPLGPDTARRQP